MKTKKLKQQLKEKICKKLRELRLSKGFTNREMFAQRELNMRPVDYNAMEVHGLFASGDIVKVLEYHKIGYCELFKN
jgi:hypothetical protein